MRVDRSAPDVGWGWALSTAGQSNENTCGNDETTVPSSSLSKWAMLTSSTQPTKDDSGTTFNDEFEDSFNPINWAD